MNKWTNPKWVDWFSSTQRLQTGLLAPSNHLTDHWICTQEEPGRGLWNFLIAVGGLSQSKWTTASSGRERFQTLPSYRLPWTVPPIACLESHPLTQMILKSVLALWPLFSAPVHWSPCLLAISHKQSTSTTDPLRMRLTQDSRQHPLPHNQHLFLHFLYQGMGPCFCTTKKNKNNNQISFFTGEKTGAQTGKVT